MAPHRSRHVPIPPTAANAILVAGVVTTASSVAHGCLWRLTWRKGHHCSSASSPRKARPLFLPSVVCLSSFTLVSSSECWKPSASTFRKRQSTHKGSSGLSASTAENCLSFLFYNASRCLNGRCGWCAGWDDRSIRVETSGLLAKVLTSDTMVERWSVSGRTVETEWSVEHRNNRSDRLEFRQWAYQIHLYRELASKLGSELKNECAQSNDQVDKLSRRWLNEAWSWVVWCWNKILIIIPISHLQ